MKALTKRGRTRHLALASVVVGLVTLGVAAQAQAAIFTVCPSGCDSTTVQGAVDLAVASPGFNDRVDVTQPGPVADTSTITVNEPGLNVRGYQRGVDPRGGARFDDADESTVNSDSGPGFLVTATGARIDGFTVEGSNPGIQTSGTASGYKIINNIIEQNVFGLYVNSEGTANTLVQRNRFQDNNVGHGVESAAGNAIYSDQGANNITVDSNQLTGHLEGGVGFFGTDQGSLKVTNNVLSNDGGVDVVNATDVDIVNNRITSSAFNSVTVNGAVTDVLIQGNLIDGAEDGGSNGINVDDDGTGVNSMVVILNNTIRNNDVGVLFEYFFDTNTATAFPSWDGASSTKVNSNRIQDNNSGVVNQVPSTTLNAENNYWGCKQGPTNPLCDSVSSGVDFVPFKTNPSKTGP